MIKYDTIKEMTYDVMADVVW